MTKYLLVPALLLVSACGGNAYKAEAPSIMMQALSTKPDGYAAIDNKTGQQFRIESTSVSSTKLCRVVSIKRNGDFVADTFCKVKGGNWH